MESILRAAHRAGDGGTAPLVVLLDDAHVIGSSSLFQQLVRLAVTDVAAGGRWVGHGVAVVAVEEPPAAYDHLLCNNSAPSNTLVDCWSNPDGWSNGNEKNVPEKQQQQQQQQLSLFGSADGLQQLQRRLMGTSITPSLVFFDSLGTLVDEFQLPAVTAMLAALRSHPSTACVLCRVHADLLHTHEVAALCLGAACIAHAVALPDASDDHRHGRMTLKFRRKTPGAVKTEALDYQVGPQGVVSFFPPLKASTAGMPAAVVAAAPAAGAAIAQQLAGGMRLEVSEAEAAARRGVQLPYEHQGQSTVYASGDFRDYLPETAGGRARPKGGLGHILYVRDSDSEEPDSDEDPDDDLDV